MTREQLEAVIWRHAPGLNAGRTADRYAAMNAVLAAAGDYATAQCAIAIGAPDGPAQAQRRAILEAALRRPRAAETVHWQKPGAAHHTTACHGKRTQAAVTGVRAAVTCGTCRQSRAWQALGVAS
jgi:hypothetical protein